MKTIHPGKNWEAYGSNGMSASGWREMRLDYDKNGMKRILIGYRLLIKH